MATTKKEKDFIINEEITARKVKVISDKDEYLGEMTLKNAITKAKVESKDLILIGKPNDELPLCRLQALDKYKYQLAKKAKADKKNQQISELKEIRLSPNIDTHDLDTKVNQMKKFLSDGNKVKIDMRFRGREVAFIDKGKAIINNIILSLGDDIKIEKNMKREGYHLTVILRKK